MRAIYKPKGKAAEYGKYAVNLYTGCTHGCSYCYVPGCLRISRDQFHASWKLREGILEQLDKDAARHPKDEPVFLSFTSDPYQPGAAATTREALKILNRHGINFTVLTKGGLRAGQDFDLYKEGDFLGITIASGLAGLDEPGASPILDRIETLKTAKWKYGIHTWASIEPVIHTRDSLLYIEILCTLGVVDHIKIGACSGNHSAVRDWKRFGEMAEEICQRHNVNYYLKEDLRRRMGVV